MGGPGRGKKARGVLLRTTLGRHELGPVRLPPPCCGPKLEDASLGTIGFSMVLVCQFRVRTLVAAH